MCFSSWIITDFIVNLFIVLHSLLNLVLSNSFQQSNCVVILDDDDDDDDNDTVVSRYGINVQILI